jgi:hypothetical protein
VTFWEVTSLHVNALRLSIAMRSRTTTTTTTDTMRRTMRNMWLETSPSVRTARTSTDFLSLTSSSTSKRMLVTAVPRRISWTRLGHPAGLENPQDIVGHSPRTWPSRKAPEIAEGVQVIPDRRSSTCSAADHWKLEHLHRCGQKPVWPSWISSAKED